MPVLLLGTASPMAAVVMVAELICGPGHAVDETFTLAVTVTRLVEAAMGKTALLAEQVKVVLLALGVHVQVAAGLTVSAFNVMPLGRVSVMAGDVDKMVVAD